MQTATVFTPIQLQLLQMFSHKTNETELREVQSLLSEYFAKKVEDAIDDLWEKGQWDNEQNENVLKEHLRTPYIHG
ncbi:hypothetical protein E5358_06375 [Palleniella muris]|uniref:Uncharacterized protein n=1 Tax=Palleniella muris TaxID=3038145 RepID=A0AC61QRK2_9BACT|nr:hypothetical protein [Palleniella muris]TGX82664.1 hypothetical protein E5358_06375 [Palleniella muris]